jgi:hypothetical protein
MIDETHTVYTQCNGVTGTVAREEWRKDNKPDRTDGQAIIERDAATGTVTYEAWWKDGKLDRVDGPLSSRATPRPALSPMGNGGRTAPLSSGATPRPALSPMRNGGGTTR